MDMMLNSLPSRTWNRLGINESFAAIEETIIKHTPAAAGDTAPWSANAGNALWQADPETGMGRDFSAALGHISPDLVQTAPGAEMTAPLKLTYSYEEGEISASRLLLHAEQGSTLSVLLLLTSPERGSAGLSAIQTQIRAEAGSHVHLYVVQLLGSGFTCFNDVSGVCDDTASVELTRLDLGAGRLYTGTLLDLKGTGADFTADVAYHVRTGELCDMNYVALHHGKHTTSLMNAAGTLEENSHKVFRGTIDFRKGCSGAKGTESENVLLMGEEMINQTIPLILCKEEDVEGNHGASIGQLDEKVLFYLSTRGIDREAAQQMIAQARIDALCSKIPDEEVRESVHEFEL